MQNQPLSREQRHEKIRRKKKRQLIAIAIMALVLVLLIVVVVSVVRAISRAGRPAMTQIGPPSPSASDTVADIPQYYDYMLAVPEAAAVPDNTFSQTLFIGDARLGGFSLYGVLSQAEILSGNSVTVSNALTYSFEDDITLSARLGTEGYTDIYLVLGVNELGWQDQQEFARAYESLIDSILKLQPDANVYLQLIVPVSSTRSGTPSYLNNDRIQSYNLLIAEIAQNRQLCFLDLSAVMCDESGALMSQYTSDGLHFNNAGISVWYEFLKTHYVAKETYVN